MDILFVEKGDTKEMTEMTTFVQNKVKTKASR